MRGHGLRRLLLIAASAALFASAAQAMADGLPILGVDASRTGLVASAGSRYVTLGADRSTVVARIETRGGEIAASRLIEGRFTIPAVAYDGSPAGLSAEGRTLVLVRPRIAFPQRHTTFTVIDTTRLRVADTITLNGDFSFDAVSPDGSTLYLIHYPHRHDLTRYEVRAFDLESGRLLPEPIVDPDEPDERMEGLPVTRTTSSDGRWAYTLYDGNGGEPFIHALDTVGQRAVCIDLPRLSGQRNLFLFRMRLEQAGRRLIVLSRPPGSAASQPLLTVNTKSFEVDEANPVATASDAGASPWPPIAIAVAVAAALAASGLFRLLRRRSRAPGRSLGPT